MRDLTQDRMCPVCHKWVTTKLDNNNWNDEKRIFFLDIGVSFIRHFAEGRCNSDVYIRVLSAEEEAACYQVRATRKSRNF